MRKQSTPWRKKARLVWSVENFHAVQWHMKMSYVWLLHDVKVFVLNEYQKTRNACLRRIDITVIKSSSVSFMGSLGRIIEYSYHLVLRVLLENSILTSMENMSDSRNQIWIFVLQTNKLSYTGQTLLNTHIIYINVVDTTYELKCAYQ